MAIANGFTTLMMHHETKDMYLEAKAKIEEKLNMKLTHSQAIEYMCKKILTVRTRKE